MPSTSYYKTLLHGNGIITSLGVPSVVAFHDPSENTCRFTITDNSQFYTSWYIGAQWINMTHPWPDSIEVSSPIQPGGGAFSGVSTFYYNTICGFSDTFAAGNYAVTPHFRYLRVTDPNGNVTGYCSWKNLMIGNSSFSDHAVFESSAVPIDNALDAAMVDLASPVGSYPYTNVPPIPAGTIDGLVFDILPTAATIGTFTFELLQIPIPESSIPYKKNIPGQMYSQSVVGLVGIEEVGGVLGYVPKFYKCIQDVPPGDCSTVAYLGSNSSLYWQEIALTAGTSDDWFNELKTVSDGKYYDITTVQCGPTTGGTKSYDCVNGSCQLVNYSTNHSSMSACQAAFPNGCTTPPTLYYDCTPSSGCTQVNYTTAYTSLTACQAAYPLGCSIPPALDYYDCIPGSGCMQVNYTTTYNTLADCNAAHPNGCSTPPRPVIDPPTVPCMESYAYKSYCAIKENECNDELLCKDKDFVNFLKLLSLSYTGFQAHQSNDDAAISNITSLINLICNCDQ